MVYIIGLAKRAINVALCIIRCLWNALINTINHDGIEHAGYMSFMVILSIFPFIVFFIALTSFLGASEIGSYFVNILMSSLPDKVTISLRNNVNSIVLNPPYKLMTIAIAGTIWTSSSFVEGMRTILNRVYHINSPPPYITRRLLSIIQFIVINFVILFIILVLVLVPLILGKFTESTKIIEAINPFWHYIRYTLIFISLFLAVSLLYYIIPNINIQYRMVIPGTLITIILWFISTYIFSNYIEYYTQLDVLYGSLGSIIASLIFFYIVNMIFIYGAEFNYEAQKKKIFIKN